MQRHWPLLVASAISLASTCAAQIELVLPAEYDRAWGRGSSALLGSNSTRTQMIFVSPFAPGTVITEVAFRPTANTTDQAAFTATMEIRLSSTNAVPGALDLTFANNIGTDEVIVLPQQVVNIPAMPANRGTGAYATIPLQTPFVFGLNGSPNLCLDVLVYSRSTGASWSTDRAFAATAGRAATHGSANCGVGTPSSSSTGGTGAYTDGSTITISATGLPPSGIAALALGVDEKELAPGLPLPFDVSVFGLAAGCELLVNPNVAVIGVPIDGAGAASWSFTLSGFSRFGFGAQYGYLITPTLANPFGMELIENRAIWAGPEVVEPFAQYVYHLSNVNSATALTTTVDSVVIVKFTIQ
jgi:hypothetical protein